MRSEFFLGLVAGSGLYAALAWLHSYWSRKRKQAQLHKDDSFFFSPHNTTVQCFKNPSAYCSVLSCSACNFKKYISLVMNTKSHLDVCLYLITSEELTKVVLSLFKKGVFVRIIVDKQMSDEACNSKVCIFLREHIPIKIISSCEIMHNKFMIIDKRIVVTGSFNWTRQAVAANYENAVVIENASTVSKFATYFDDMWVSAN